ncbi:MAG TPA: phosphoribosylanthranilate isomerase [Bryobacteraceae bacterium]|nr:phosphoribosylanthranilate isomerase [Bryobacteraceae bacterium]
MFVKICGITNRGDALAAVDAGARVLGFNFYEKSPRFVTAARIAEFAAEIPKDVWKVGIFVNESPARIEEICAQLALDVAQLHGAETPDSHPRGVRVWKAFRIVENRIPDPNYPAEALLLDGPASGSGFDWPLAAQLERKVIVAGGLDENNVRAAIEQARPWGVDVSSRIESSPGKKDHVRMKKFIEAALCL